MAQFLIRLMRSKHDVVNLFIQNLANSNVNTVVNAFNHVALPSMRQFVLGALAWEIPQIIGFHSSIAGSYTQGRGVL